MKESSLEKLKKILRAMEKVLVAYSGGVDSTFLLKVAGDVLGRDGVLAVTAVSDTYTAGELKLSKSIAKKLKVQHLLIHTCETANPLFAANPPNRCYYCKQELYSRLKSLAASKGIPFIIEGSNLDDLTDFRPGRKSLVELGIRSPMVEAGLDKAQIRKLSKKMKLPTWNIPPQACLASRIPYNTEISPEKLRRIALAEEYLRSLGFQGFRVRDHGEIARLEFLPEDMKRLRDPRLTAKIVRKLKSLSYAYVAMDMEGYRSGSMNEVIPWKKKKQ
jgi:uncharacterized protein